MTGPYPEAETAAHMLAEEVLACERNMEAVHDFTYWQHRGAGVMQAAYLLGIESSVIHKLREAKSGAALPPTRGEGTHEPPVEVDGK